MYNLRVHKMILYEIIKFCGSLIVHYVLMLEKERFIFNSEIEKIFFSFCFLVKYQNTS